MTYTLVAILKRKSTKTHCWEYANMALMIYSSKDFLSWNQPSNLGVTKSGIYRTLVREYEESVNGGMY